MEYLVLNKFYMLEVYYCRSAIGTYNFRFRCLSVKIVILITDVVYFEHYTGALVSLILDLNLPSVGVFLISSGSDFH